MGGGRDASWLAGVNVDRVTIATYGIGSLCAALAGLVLLGQTNIGQPSTAESWPLAAIAAVVVGGVPLSGGVGGVGAALLGTLLLGVVANALNLFSVSPFWQPAITGLVILVAVGLDSYQRKRAGAPEPWASPCLRGTRQIDKEADKGGRMRDPKAYPGRDRAGRCPHAGGSASQCPG